MEKFVETITLTRDSYDALVKEISNLKEIRGKLLDNEKKLNIENAVLISEVEELKDYIWDNFSEDNNFDLTHNFSYESYMAAYGRRIDKESLGYAKDYDKVNCILGHEFIEKKVKEYYDNASKESND